MNYRHAFHAGNFADCMKHALLVWLLSAMQRKPTPVSVLDTHAGAGGYDLEAAPAQRTGESADGILRLLQDTPTELAPYVNLVGRLQETVMPEAGIEVTGLRHYPGSPELARALLRPDDHLTCCELHPEDAAVLRRRFARDRMVAVHQRSGWEALGALLPLRHKRGLILIDPPFEATDEFHQLVHGLAAGYARFRPGVFAAWYPIKHRTPVRQFHAALRETGIRDIVAAEFLLRPPLDAGRLNGCGLLVINPPFRFETEGLDILNALLARLARGMAGAEAAMIRLSDE